MGTLAYMSWPLNPVPRDTFTTVQSAPASISTPSWRLNTQSRNAGRLCGHVAPLASQYWNYGLRSAGFSEITLRRDRIKKSAAGLAILFWPILKLATAWHLRALARREPALFEETAEVARAANSWPALASRSLVFQAVKR
jgi:hypothetical protein